LTICAYYPWERALNVGLDASFDNIKEWKRIREKSREVDSTKNYVANGESAFLTVWCDLVW
jgi:hypothetical protein